MMQQTSRRRRGLALLAASATTLAGSALLLGPGIGTASSHREAPQILKDPLADNTDVYAFVSPDQPETVTLISAWDGFQDPSGGPNFYPWDEDAQYDIKIDNNGDAVPDITYRWTFDNDDRRVDANTFLYANGPVTSLDDENLLFRQTYTLERIAGDGAATTVVEGGQVAPSFVGDASIPDYAVLRDQAITPLEAGGQSYVGQSDDPFFIDLRVFDLLYGGDLSQTGVDTLDGKNVNTVALQVPKADLVSDGDPVIGIWSTTNRQSMSVINADGTREKSGDFVQVSRLGNPLVNEVVIPVGLKDAFNSLAPQDDASVQAAVDRVNDPEVPKLIEQIYGIPAPETPREDLFAVFLTGVEGLNKPQGEVQPAEVLRLNTSIAPAGSPNRLGVLAEDTQGFPNGRRLTDDVVDIGLQALEGAVRTGELVEALAAGDGVNSNDKEFGSTFPYLALPHSGTVGLESRSGGTGGSGSGSPSGGVGAGFGGTAGESVPVAAAAVAGLGVLLGAAGLVTLRRGRRAGAV
ncbi:MAG TPA: DUF4331 domain-containing protein [Mycobacteriales bacterium]|nr:DUF4331 domain-containing protein [Mycobacteriales bacterium]